MALIAQPRTVGITGADYPTLKGAFDAINSGTLTGAITLQIITNTSESASAILNASGSGSATYSSVLIYPTVSGLSISGNLAAPLIDLNGADNVTIDGRVNATGSTKDLIITNTSTSNTSGTSTIRFINDANNNTVKYCVLKGSEMVATSGIVFFSTSTRTTGNDGNLIDNNDITNSANADRPLNAIFSLGSSMLLDNSGNTISNNNIFDFLNPGTVSNGILLSTFSSGWTITDNHFFETASFAPTASVVYNIIRIINAGGNYTVSDNFIGGNNPAGDPAWTKTNASNNIFYGIYISAATATASSIQNNTIRDIDWRNSLNGDWTGIHIAAGFVNVSSNNIGSDTGINSISVTCSENNNNVYGINITGTGTVNCLNNIIGSITLANTDAYANNFYGISKTIAAGNTTINNNIIGSKTQPNSIFATSLSTSSPQAWNLQ
jgi:hypothetical protein